MIFKFWQVQLRIILDNTDANNTLWPEFEIIIEDESDNNNTDISESNALTSSLISKSRNDDMMNSIVESFQVLPQIHL